MTQKKTIEEWVNSLDPKVNLGLLLENLLIKREQIIFLVSGLQEVKDGEIPIDEKAFLHLKRIKELLGIRAVKASLRLTQINLRREIEALDRLILKLRSRLKFVHG